MLNLRRQNATLIFALMADIVFSVNVFSQQAYFADGYHGGVYGHYPSWKTGYMVEMLEKNPSWKINLEIEPETWNFAKDSDVQSYHAFRELYSKLASSGRIEFVNPAYAQPYCFNISGESLIRQFTYGIRKTKEHFPDASFITYSSEEPCFTSCLPQILKSLGFQYAVLKNSDTCWGGYTRAFGGELVNWIGPDGTTLVAVPRYGCEGLEPGSTWQTMAWHNSAEYIKACFEHGIENPVGMCYQDAGWRGGPWLKKNYYQPTEYITWTNYIENISIKKPQQDWMFSQEDVLVSLMWGSQVLQKLAQQVRVSENKILVAEKLASMAGIYEAMPWPGESFDQAWRALMLAQHHDCWIVPYNKRHGDTWADMVTKWTGTTNRSCDGIIESSVIQLSENSFDSDDKYVRVFNTLGAQRHEPVTLALPETLKMSHCRILDSRGNEVSSQLIHDPVTRERAILFLPDVPSMGYNTYRIQPVEASTKTEASVNKRNDGTYQLETDLYRIILDPARGGILKSLIAKEIGSREFIDRNSERGFNALRGHFYDEGGFLDSSQNLATVDILENGPVRIRVKVNGTIAASPFSQMITLVQGQKRIDFDVTIDWKSNLGIGAYSQSKDYDTKNPKKAFYQDKFKLRALFPLNLESQKVYKNAPFDVCQSRLNDTFFDSWDSIKHNLIVNWVDVTDASDQFGVALFSDHTTSYTHGREEPLGLTLQYSGKGLWGRNYSITGPTNVRYAIIPHRGKWDESGIWTEGAKWNEPLIAQVMNAAPQTSDYKRTLLAIDGQDIEVVSLMFEEHTLYIRLFNAESGASTSRLSFDCIADSVELVELNGDVISRLDVSKNAKAGMAIDLSIPKFGVRTLKLSNVKSVHTDSF